MNALLLQSSIRFDEIARFDPQTGQHVLEMRTDDLPVALDGHFCSLSGLFVALYRLNQHLYVVVGKHTLPLNASTSVTTTGPSEARKLRISHPDFGAHEIGYRLTERENVEDVTAFAEQEDFDFGLFLSNIAADEARQKVLLLCNAE